MTEQQRREMDRMQEDAIKRMREMNSKGKQQGTYPPSPDFVRMNGKASPSNHSAPNKKEEKKPIVVTDEPKITHSKGFSLLKMLNFSNFKMDSDFTVIIAMILLLSSEESDELLLLALLYIML